jgi:signal transduction histidine kinase
MSVRLRFALLYSGAFLISGLVIVMIAFLSVSSTQEAGSAGPAVVRHPFENAFGPLSDVITAVAVLVVLSVLFGWLLASRLLRPVRTMTAAARDISASNLSRRLRLGHRDDEFTRLGATLNDLLARLEAAFAAQRHFVANASHELRTPLTAERTLLQVALADPDADADSLREACEQVPALGAAESGGDPVLAERLIANLVENALRYNVPGGWVEVSTGTTDGLATVSVRNTGPVVPAADVGRLFQPFTRLAGSRVQHLGGHGLGLAIVRVIADAHGASVTARAREAGGLDITVAFPATGGPGWQTCAPSRRSARTGC